jgi:hypothetical protein
MSRFELPKAVRDPDSILNEYRLKKSRGNHTDSDKAEFLRGDNDKPPHSRLNEIAEALRTLTYGEMIELAESMWKLNSQGSEITESALPNVLYRWSKSRSIAFVKAVEHPSLPKS